MANRKSVDYQLRPDRDLTVLIPARAGSKRIPHKNTRLLGGKPLIQWTLDAAKAANVHRIIVSSDDKCVFRLLALDHGFTGAIHVRKPEHATDSSPDIEWVLDVLPMVKTPYVAICRPTSPFRTASTIRRCFAAFLHSGADSIRAVERVTHPHPAKMWIIDGDFMRPVMAGGDLHTGWHSMPTQCLPIVYKQNASLEMTSVGSIQRSRSISGFRIAPFLTEPLEGFDVNYESDLVEAERLIGTR